MQHNDFGLLAVKSFIDLRIKTAKTQQEKRNLLFIFLYGWWQLCTFIFVSRRQISIILSLFRFNLGLIVVLVPHPNFTYQRKKGWNFLQQFKCCIRVYTAVFAFQYVKNEYMCIFFTEISILWNTKKGVVVRKCHQCRPDPQYSSVPFLFHFFPYEYEVLTLKTFSVCLWWHAVDQAP